MCVGEVRWTDIAVNERSDCQIYASQLLVELVGNVEV